MLLIPPPTDDFLFTKGGKIFLAHYAPVIERSKQTKFKSRVIGYAKKTVTPMPRWCTMAPTVRPV